MQRGLRLSSAQMTDAYAQTRPRTWSCLGISDCNYGGSQESDDLRAANIPHTMLWDAGGDYAAGQLVWIDREYAEVSVFGPVAHVDERGTVSSSDIDFAKKWYRLSKLFDEYVAQGDRR